MKDIIAKYKKQTFLKNTGIVLTSFALAFAIHTFWFGGDLGKYVKANVLEGGVQVEENSDIYFDMSENVLTLKNEKMMHDVKHISFSIVYDANSTELSNFKSLLADSNTTTITNEQWLATLILNLDSPTSINPNTDIFTIQAKKIQEGTGYINLINANFTDEEEKEYLLSTSGILY